MSEVNEVSTPGMEAELNEQQASREAAEAPCNDSEEAPTMPDVSEAAERDDSPAEQQPVKTYDEQLVASSVEPAEAGANTQTEEHVVYAPVYAPAHTAEAAEAGHHGTLGATISHGKGLTFSSPPYVPKAKPYLRADYSHSTVKLIKIAHDNQLLVQRLTSISHKEPGWAKDLTHAAPCNTASSAVNRRKAAATIAQENHALYQRLVAIRPSKDISRETLEAEHRRNEAYRVNYATFKPEAAAGQQGHSETA